MMLQSSKLIISCFMLGNILLLFILNHNGLILSTKSISTDQCQTAVPKNETRLEQVKKGYIVVDLLGGIGNKMFIYSTLYALAKRSNRVAIACVNSNMGQLFPNLSIRLRTKEECKLVHPESSLMLYQENNALYYDTGMVQRVMNAHQSHIYICCYFQNIGFFADYMSELREDFAIAPSWRSRAETYLEEQLLVYRRNNSGIGVNDTIQFVGIHVRRGEMSRFKGIVTPPLSYYNKAMTYFRQKFRGKVIFIVSSMAHEWSENNLIGKDVIFTWNNGSKSYEEDFSILASCNHTIMSFGTFGWWAGFLLKGEVVAFKDWVGTSKFAAWYLPGQRFPIGWKLM